MKIFFQSAIWGRTVTFKISGPTSRKVPSLSYKPLSYLLSQVRRKGIVIVWCIFIVTLFKSRDKEGKMITECVGRRTMIRLNAFGVMARRKATERAESFRRSASDRLPTNFLPGSYEYGERNRNTARVTWQG